MERLPQFRRSAPAACRSPCWPAVVCQHRVEERYRASAPVGHDFMQPKEPADVRLVEGEQRLCDMSGRSGRARPRCVRPELELEPTIQLAEIMQEGQERQARGRAGFEPSRAGSSAEPCCQYRIPKQGFEASCYIGAVMFETVDAS